MAAPESETWNPPEDPLPPDASATDVLRRALRWAILAPSGHNTQPWRFVLGDGLLELRADRSRRLPVADPADRTLVMSCGAALFHLRTALHHLERRPVISLFPAGEASNLLARIRPGHRQPPGDEEEALFRAIPERRSNRGPFLGGTLPPGLLEALSSAARTEGAVFRPVVGEAEKEAVTELVAEGDRIQASDPSFRAELAEWVRPNRSPARDGIPGYALGMSDLASLAGPFVLRAFDWGDRQARRDRELALGAPALGIFSTPDDAPRGWLRTGQALDRVLLRAAVEGISASFLNQPIEVVALRPRLRDALDLDGRPQLLIRLGHPSREARPTPRRGVDEVVVGR